MRYALQLRCAMVPCALHFGFAMLCSALLTLRCDILCCVYAMICCAARRCAALRCATVCYAICYDMLRCLALCYAYAFRHALLCDALCHAMQLGYTTHCYNVLY